MTDYHSLLQRPALKASTLVALFSGAVALHLPIAANALEQSYSVDGGASYDTNPAMDSEDDESVWRGFVTPRYLMHWQEGPLAIGANAALRVERSSDTDLSVDREDPSVGVTLERAYAKGTFNAEVGYREESTRISELDDTGRVFFDGTRSEASIDLGLNHTLSEQTELGLAADFQDVSFEDGTFVDYQLLEVDSTLTFEMSRRTNTYVLGRLSRNEPEGDIRSNADAATLLAGVTYRLSEKTEVDFSVGGITVSADDDEDDWNGTAKLTHTGEVLTAGLEYQRITTASGSGEFRAADRIAGDLRYSLSELTTLVFSSWWRKNLGENKTETFRIGLQSDTKLSNSWTVSPSVEYRDVKREGLGDADGAAITLQISYVLPRRF